MKPKTERLLTNVHFRRVLDPETRPVACVQWVQLKQETDGVRVARVDSVRHDAHHDVVDIKHTVRSRLRLAAPRQILEPRYSPQQRTKVRTAGEALCKKLEQLVDFDVIGFGYAPGSPAVDVWGTKPLGSLTWSGNEAITDAKIRASAQRFAELVASTLADPDQPVTSLPMLKAPTVKK